MMGQFKKGDWVRVVDNAGSPRLYRVGEICKVSSVSLSGLVSCGGKDASMYDYRFETWQPKVGERVRVAKHVNSYGDPIRMDLPIGSIHTVTRVGDALSNKDRPSFTLSGSGVQFYLAENLEPVTDTLPVAEQPAALQIQAGKFYKTRDGRKVGPMVPYTDNIGDWEYKWTNTPDPDRGRLWREDGTSGRGMPEHDLIAEWVDAPVPVPNLAATVDAINDEYGPVFRGVPVLVAEQPARTMIRTKNGYGFELARVGDYVWVDIGQTAPITVPVRSIRAA